MIRNGITSWWRDWRKSKISFGANFYCCNAMSEPRGSRSQNIGSLHPLHLPTGHAMLESMMPSFIPPGPHVVMPTDIVSAVRTTDSCRHHHHTGLLAHGYTIRRVSPFPEDIRSVALRRITGRCINFLQHEGVVPTCDASCGRFSLVRVWWATSKSSA
jgi:hypothetical protein